jgi:murein DD-endopeptidase MepM/ murein hydrolase activator NlpD
VRRRTVPRWGLATALAVAGSATTLAVGATPVTAAPAGSTGTVASGPIPLNIRSGPSVASGRVGTLPDGSAVTVVCQVAGQTIRGAVRATDRWDRLDSGGFVSDGYLRRTGTPPNCSASSGTAGTLVPPAIPPSATTGSWVNPVGLRGAPGFRTPTLPDHDGVDIVVRRNTPVHAASGGVVLTVECNTSGTTCDVDGAADTRGCGWYLEIQHPNGVITRYCHLVSRPVVNIGQRVAPGQLVGYVGSSGHSGRPHLHYEVHLDGGYATRQNAVDPALFMRLAGAPVTD